MTSTPRSPDPEGQQQDPQIQNPNTIVDLDQKPEEPQQSHPQSPKTLILETPDLPNTTAAPIADQLDLDRSHDHQELQEPQAPADDDQEQANPEGMPLSPSQTLTVLHGLSSENPPATANRRGNKRKKPMPPLKRQAFEKKLRILHQNFKPVIFLPVKTLDFSKHEDLLKRLGLWDFVRLEFDRNIRADLIAQLIVNFVPATRKSYVNQLRVVVSRAALARALKLPVKKDKVNVPEAVDCDADVLSGESLTFIEDFVSNWVLLHEDTWMMPKDVLAATRLIKEGHPEKVDWAGLIWFMVEKELSQGRKLGHCYYASHLQCLIKSQREDVFAEEPLMEIDLKEGDGGKVEIDIKEEEEEDEEEGDGGKVEIDIKEEGDGGKVESDIKEEEDQGDAGKAETGNKEEEEEEEKGVGGNAEVDAKEEQNEEGDGVKAEVDLREEVEDGDDVKMADLDGFQCHQYEGQGLELTLGQEKVEKEEDRNDVMDFEESKEEETGHWFSDGKNSCGEQFLQRCNVREVGSFNSDVERKEEEGEGEEEEEEDEQEQEQEMLEEEEEDEGLQEGGFTLMPSANHIQTMEVGQMAFSSGGQLNDHSSRELLSSRANTHTMPAGPSIFSNSTGRDIDHENDISLHALNGSHKRLRTDGPWDNKPLDFYTCMDQIHHWMGKARMMYEAKEECFTEGNMNQQILVSELQQRDSMIEHLHKTKLEELQKKQVEIYRLERELFIMGNLLEGYRKALKETRSSFAEYRRRCPQLDEPLYKDVGGNAGLVLSTTEIERQCLKRKEEEMMTQLMIRKMISDFEAGWDGKLEAHRNKVDMMFNKVVDFEKDVTVLKDFFARRKVSNPPVCASEE